MDDPVLLARVERGDDGKLLVRAPGVGIWSDHPRPGTPLGSGSRVGTLTRLNRRFALLLPDGAAGVVVGAAPGDRSVAVGYDDVLVTLAPLGTGEAGSSTVAGANASLAAGTWVVVSPTDGTFYLRPSPGAPPFVEVGTRVSAGQPVGLVEVMKTFNHVLYGGPGLPEEAEVVEVRCVDAQDVHAGDVLLVLR